MDHQMKQERRAKYEALLAGSRWVWTLGVPVMAVSAVLSFHDHDSFGEWVFCFNALIMTLLSIRAWAFKARLDRRQT